MAKLFPDVFNNALQTTNSSEIASWKYNDNILPQNTKNVNKEVIKWN
jgi:hypothetical protein